MSPPSIKYSTPIMQSLIQYFLSFIIIIYYSYFLTFLTLTISFISIFLREFHPRSCMYYWGKKSKCLLSLSFMMYKFLSNSYQVYKFFFFIFCLYKPLLIKTSFFIQFTKILKISVYNVTSLASLFKDFK